MGYTVFRPDERAFQAPQRGDQRRRLAPLSGALHNMRANIWRLPPGVRGARHLERVQEEMFVVLEGTATLLLGDPPERVELPCRTSRNSPDRTPNNSPPGLVRFFYPF
jgi:hypothetical protein